MVSAAKRGKKIQIPQPAVVSQKTRGLDQRTDGKPMRILRREFFPFDDNAPRRGREHSADCLEQNRFTGAVSAHQAGDFSRQKGAGNLVQHLSITESHRKLLYFDHFQNPPMSQGLTQSCIF